MDIRGGPLSKSPLVTSPPSPTPSHRSPLWEGSSPPPNLGFVVVSCIKISPCTWLLRSIWEWSPSITALHGCENRRNFFNYYDMRWILLCIYHCVGIFIVCRTLEAHHDVYCFSWDFLSNALFVHVTRCTTLSIGRWGRCINHAHRWWTFQWMFLFVFLCK
jgi:hypothetical protein